jgi:hypothetical protein
MATIDQIISAVQAAPIRPDGTLSPLVIVSGYI